MLELKLVQNFRRFAFEDIAALEIDLEGRVWVLDSIKRTLSSIDIKSANERNRVAIDLQKPHAFAISGEYAFILNETGNEVKVYNFNTGKEEMSIITTIDDGEPHHFHGITCVNGNLNDPIGRFLLYNPEESLIEYFNLDFENGTVDTIAYSIKPLIKNFGENSRISFVKSNKVGKIYAGFISREVFEVTRFGVNGNGIVSPTIVEENSNRPSDIYSVDAYGNLVISSWFDGEKIWWRLSKYQDTPPFPAKIPGPRLRMQNGSLVYMPRPTQDSVVAVNYANGRMLVAIGRDYVLGLYEVFPESLDKYGLRPQTSNRPKQ